MLNILRSMYTWKRGCARAYKEKDGGKSERNKANQDWLVNEIATNENVKMAVQVKKIQVNEN